MSKFLAFLLLLFTPLAFGQALTGITGVNAQLSSYFSGPCSTGRTGFATDTGAAYRCVNAAWTRADIPSCTGAPPSGSCSGTPLCVTTTGSYSQLYTCKSNVWAPITVASGGSSLKGLQSTYVTVGPGTDTNGDGVIAVNEGPWDYNCDIQAGTGYALAGSSDTNPCLQGAIDAAAGTSARPTTITLMPGTYNISDTVTIADKQYLTIRGTGLETQLIGTAMFDVTGTSDNIVFDNFAIGTRNWPALGAGLSGQAIVIEATPTNGGTYELRNLHFDSRVGGTAMVYAIATTSSPGPLIILANNYCHDTHPCVNSTYTSSGYYARFISSGNIWFTEGGTLPAVNLNGHNVDWISTGDTYISDCVGLGIAYTDVGSPPAQGRRVLVTGATFNIGNPKAVSRADCSVYTNGAFPVFIGPWANAATTITSDRAADIIQIADSQAYVVRDTHSSHHGLLGHWGTNSVPVISNFTLRTDDTTNFSTFYFSSTGTASASGISTPVVSVASSDTSNLIPGLQVSPTRIFESFNTDLVLRSAASGNRRVYFQFSRAAAWFSNFIIQPSSDVTTVNFDLTGNTLGGVSNAPATNFVFNNLFLGIKTGGGDTTGLNILPATTGDAGGVDLIPVFDELTYYTTSKLGSLVHPWQRMWLSNEGTGVGALSYSTVGGATKLWSDTSGDGTVGTGDVCLGAAGVDINCDGTLDTTSVSFTQTADKTVNTTNAETTLTAAGTGSLTIPASALNAGSHLRIRAYGYQSNTASPTLDLRVKLGATTFCDTTALTVNNASAMSWEMTCDITTRAAAGAAVATTGQGIGRIFTAASTQITGQTAKTSTTNLATNGTLAVDVTAQWSASNASNTITCTNLTVEKLR